MHIPNPNTRGSFKKMHPGTISKVIIVTHIPVLQVLSTWVATAYQGWFTLEESAPNSWDVFVKDRTQVTAQRCWYRAVNLIPTTDLQRKILYPQGTSAKPKQSLSALFLSASEWQFPFTIGKHTNPTPFSCWVGDHLTQALTDYLTRATEGDVCTSYGMLPFHLSCRTGWAKRIQTQVCSIIACQHC